nr:MAG TPA: hypothetical protein [Caudoviricetes sp.]
MEVIIKGEAKEIAALLFEVEGRRSVPFVGEVKYGLVNKPNSQPVVDSAK